MPQTKKTKPTRSSSVTRKAATSARAVKTVRMSDSETMSARPAYNMSNVSMMKNNRQLLALFVLGIVAGLLYYYRGAFVVAFVNGAPITRYQVVKELEGQGGKAALDSLVTQKLIRQDAARKGVTVSQKEVDDRMKAIESQLKSSGQTLDAVLKAQGLTRKQVEEQTELQFMMKKLLGDKVKVTDKDVETAYASQKASKPKDVTEEAFKRDLKESLENQKLSFEAQTYIQKLQKDAQIQYWHSY